jgi:outer membrane protein OmpA-like peptidoglycan-associated protein
VEEPPPPAPEPEPAPPAQDENAPQEPDSGAQLPPDQLPPDQLPPDQPAEVEPVVPESSEDNTVDQQLEAQGDEEEANRVRTLRERLLDQYEQAIVPDTIGPDGQPDRGIRNWYGDDDVVEQRGNNIIIDLGNGQIYVQPVVPDDANRLLYGADDVEVQQLRGGRTRTIVYRRNGTQIITLRDRHGEIIRRTRVLPDGTEIVLIDNRFDDDDFDRPPPLLFNVPPPRIVIPRDQYIVDLGRADYDDVRGALLAPLVTPPERPYTLEEVLRNEPVRAYSPRIDLDTITFDFGSATIGRDQMRSLADLGQALQDVIAEHPDEVYLIEGHTDAVGTEYDNLILSDRRAESVAVALSQNFDIPPENLISQGYGEQYLKVDTDGPERRNRRATIRRVTELLQAQN